MEFRKRKTAKELMCELSIELILRGIEFDVTESARVSINGNWFTFYIGEYHAHTITVHESFLVVKFVFAENKLDSLEYYHTVEEMFEKEKF